MSNHLQTLSDELSDFTILGVLLTPDDEVDEARGVPEHRGSVGLGYANKAGRVNLEES